jgi:hypothetical protein
MNYSDNDTIRQSLLDQVRYLIDEIDALRRHIVILSDVVISSRPLPEELSIKEIYALLACYDEAVHLPALRRAKEEGQLEVDVPENELLLGGTNWNEMPIGDILTHVETARRSIVRELENLATADLGRTILIEGRETDLYGLIYSITQHDVALLQVVATRLNESRLTNR